MKITKLNQINMDLLYLQTLLDAEKDEDKILDLEREIETLEAEKRVILDNLNEVEKEQ